MFQILLETVPYRQWIIVTPRASPPLLLYRIVKYEYSYCKVLYLPYYRIEPTTVPTVLYCTAVSTTYYLLPTTYYLLPATT